MLHARTVGPSVGRSILRHPVLVVAITTAFVLAGYLYSSQQDERYTAVTRLFLSSSAAFDGVGQASYVVSPDRYAVNQAELVLSAPVLTSAIEEGDLGGDVESLRQMLSVSAGRGTDVITIEATSESPADAAEVANAVASAYQSLKLQEVERQTNQLTTLSTSEEDRAAVLKRAAVYGDGIELIEVADPPAGPSFPQPVRDALLAFIVGAVIAVGAAVGIDVIGAAVRDRQIPPTSRRRRFRRRVNRPAPTQTEADASGHTDVVVDRIEEYSSTSTSVS